MAIHIPGPQGGAARIAIVGAGPVGCASVALLARAGHAPALWSPTGRHLLREGERASFICTGALQGEVQAQWLPSPESLREFDTVLVCLPATAYAPVLGPLNALWRPGQHVVVSGALSLLPLWILAQATGAQGRLRVSGWGTTLTTAHFLADGRLHLNPARDRIDMATVGSASAGDDCTAIFGPRFAVADNLLAPALANINPIAHAAEVIPNLTRMDRGEQWSLFAHFGPVVARMAEDLDAERRAVGAALGIALPSLRQHYARSYHVPEQALDGMAASMVAKGMSPHGPARLDHRYVLEDAPFGLAFLEAVAALAQVPTPVLNACLTVLGSAYGRDLRAENFLLDALGLAASDPASLLARCTAAENAATLVR